MDKKNMDEVVKMLGLEDKLRNMPSSLQSALLAAAFGIGLGGLLCYLANEGMALKFILFSPDPLPILLFAVILIGLQILVSFCICHGIEKTSLIENLRME